VLKPISTLMGSWTSRTWCSGFWKST